VCYFIQVYAIDFEYYLDKFYAIVFENTNFFRSLRSRVLFYSSFTRSFSKIPNFSRSFCLQRKLTILDKFYTIAFENTNFFRSLLSRRAICILDKSNTKFPPAPFARGVLFKQFLRTRFRQYKFFPTRSLRLAACYFKSLRRSFRKYQIFSLASLAAYYFRQVLRHRFHDFFPLASLAACYFRQF